MSLVLDPVFLLTTIVDVFGAVAIILAFKLLPPGDLREMVWIPVWGLPVCFSIVTSSILFEDIVVWVQIGFTLILALFLMEPLSKLSQNIKDKLERKM